MPEDFFFTAVVWLCQGLGRTGIERTLGKGPVGPCLAVGLAGCAAALVTWF